MPARNQETGQYTETYPLDEFLLALHRTNTELGTKDVQQQIGCEYRTAIAKLNELEEKGKITSRKVGNAYLWKLDESGDVDQSKTDEDAPQADDISSNETERKTASSKGTYDPTKEWE